MEKAGVGRPGIHGGGSPGDARIRARGRTVSAFADTSFLCALYHKQPGTDRADEYMRSNAMPLVVTSLVRFEFLQGTRIEAWRHDMHRMQSGYPLGEALALQLRFEDEV